MAYDNKPFVAKSVDQMQKEYMERPFMLRSFYVGSQFTIVEDHIKSAPLRYKIETSQKTGKPYGTYLIKINDGYITKDLSLFPDEVISLFRTLPKTILNLNGVTVANENGKWVFVAQTTPDMNENMPKSNQIAASMEPAQIAPTDIGNQIKALYAAMQTNQATAITNSFKVVLDIAEKMRPGDALHLVTEAKKQGWITERVVDGITTYRAE